MKIAASCRVAACLLSFSAAANADDVPVEPPPPYFASMRFAQTNMRVGPGKDYPINWVYRRKGLPVRVIDVHQEWRNVVDPFGDKGWVARNQITLGRSVITTGPKSLLRANPSPDSGTIAKVESGVVGKVVSCAGSWCQLEMAGRRGWIDRDDVWGVGGEETIQGE